jgi:hypothetical protein
MGDAGLSIVMKSTANAVDLLRPLDLHAIPPTLVKREAAQRRTKIWEFSSHLHCSIIGTCLSTSELRHVLEKFGLLCRDCTDHELHGIGVTLAGRHDDAARHLHKALDHRHRLAVSQFAKADSEDALRAMWRNAVKRGDIPGAYWATLTHALATQPIVREAFGEVHMLSHLVGSANRADISRLCALEADKAVLQEKLERQQQALHEAVAARDARIKELRGTLAQRIVADTREGIPEASSALHDLIRDLERRLATEARRRAAIEQRLTAALSEAIRERSARVKAASDADAMRRELDAAEATLVLPPDHATNSGAQPEIRLDGLVLLYVGGRANQIASMRVSAERLGATFLHHDGGVENHPNLLPGLASRSDIVLFPVDCISHEAASAVKALCRQTGKRFIPLRSASITSLRAALQAPEITTPLDAADSACQMTYRRRNSP